jgi:hypothetical protein
MLGAHSERKAFGNVSPVLQRNPPHPGNARFRRNVCARRMMGFTSWDSRDRNGPFETLSIGAESGRADFLDAVGSAGTGSDWRMPDDVRGRERRRGGGASVDSPMDC